MKLYKIKADGIGAFYETHCIEYIRCDSEEAAYDWVSQYIARDKFIRRSMLVSVEMLDEVPDSYGREATEIPCNHA